VKIDLRTAQLLNSRLFHDLVGAAGAINTGLEFLNDADGADDALALMRKSADRLNNRLGFFRVAFGLGGGAQGSLTLIDGGILAAGWYADAKPTLMWPDTTAIGAVGNVPPTAVKTLMILAMLAEECLPRGGEVSVDVARIPEGLGLTVSARGAGARAPDGVPAALSIKFEQEKLTSRNVAGYFAAALANQLMARLESAESLDTVQFASLVPVAALSD